MFIAVLNIPYDKVIVGMGFFKLASLINFVNLVFFVALIYILPNPKMLNLGAVGVAIAIFMSNLFIGVLYRIYAKHKCKILNLKSKNSMKRSQAERLAVNTTIQGSAADLIKVAMINIQRKIDSEKLPVRLILQIHDELVFELPRSQVKQHCAWISREMTDAIKLDVPLKVDVKYGTNWLGDE